MKQFVCINKCYPNRLCKVGDIVGAEVRDLAPLCFAEIESTEEEAIKEEVKEKTNGEVADESPKVFSNADIVKAKRNKTIAGEENSEKKSEGKKSTRKKV